MRIFLGIMSLFLWIEGSSDGGMLSAAAQESENMGMHMDEAPLIPQDLWERVCRSVGFAGEVPGVNARFHQNIQAPDHVISSMIEVFSDLRAAPLFVNRLGDLLMHSPENTVLAVHLAYRLLGASAGGFGPPLAGTVPKYELPNDSGSADVMLRKILEIRNDNGESGGIDKESETAWHGLPMSVKRLVLAVLQAAVEARPFLGEAYEGLFKDEGVIKEDDADSFLRLYDRFRRPWAEPGEIPDHKVFEALERIDLDYLSCAARIFFEGVQKGIEEYRRGDHEIGLDFRGFTFDTAFGKVAVFGRGADRIGKDYAIVIDLGGDDTYLGCLAASRSFSQPIGIVVDCGGHDLYDSQGEAVSFGCGCFGIGAVYDLDGNDRYLCGESGLGSAFYGTGLIVDYSGDDQYTGKGSWTQGAAHVGVGMLIDMAGNDVYHCGSGSQAYGSTLGVGMLLDYSGNDTYHARMPDDSSSEPEDRMHAFVQGAGCGRWADATDGHSLAGGFGIMLEAAGDDLYSGGAFCQGAGYWWGFGACEDRGGNDVYRNRSYALGAGAHHAIGCHHDIKGNDSYNHDNQSGVETQLQGYARDGSIGVFLDDAGDDLYVHRNRCAGSADLNSAALFWDRGGNDSYRCLREGPYAADLSYGDAPPPVGVGEGEKTLFHPVGLRSVGIFLDTGGKDDYREIVPDLLKPGYLPLRFGNDREWRHRRGPYLFGFGLDAEIP